jgi:hypothetical protein
LTATRFDAVAAGAGAIVRSHETDATGWRWRVSWREIELGAWNDMDGVAIVADIGPWDEWVGLRERPADPSDADALEWAVGALEPWLAEPDNAARIAVRASERGSDDG